MKIAAFLFLNKSVYIMKYLFLLLIFFLSMIYLPAHAQQNKPVSQYPSPMQENVRRHYRIQEKRFSGYNLEIQDLLPKLINVYIPLKAARSRNVDMLIHFLGNKNVVHDAADHYKGKIIAVTINLGAGSSVYAHPFTDSMLFERLIDTVQAAIKNKLHHTVHFHHLIVSCFSAGYGAVRSILHNPADFKLVDEVLLLDGLHGDYIPDREVLAQGGKIDTVEYIAFLKFCRLASEKHGRKRFLFTHSEIFPGTFASTTESADYLLHTLGIRAHPILKWGPCGMQQISEARRNHFEIMGFAGNSAPDHIDHLQGLWYFLNRVKKL